MGCDTGWCGEYYGLLDHRFLETMGCQGVGGGVELLWDFFQLICGVQGAADGAGLAVSARGQWSRRRG